MTDYIERALDQAEDEETAEDEAWTGTETGRTVRRGRRPKKGPVQADAAGRSGGMEEANSPVDGTGGEAATEEKRAERREAARGGEETDEAAAVPERHPRGGRGQKKPKGSTAVSDGGPPARKRAGVAPKGRANRTPEAPTDGSGAQLERRDPLEAARTGRPWVRGAATSHAGTAAGSGYAERRRAGVDRGAEKLYRELRRTGEAAVYRGRSGGAVLPEVAGVRRELSIRALDLEFQRDARRYDGGFAAE